MKSKKVLVPVILLVVVIIAVTFTFTKKSNNETTNKETSVTDSTDSSNPSKEDTPDTNPKEVPSDSNKDTESKDNTTENKNTESKDSNSNSAPSTAGEPNKDSNSTPSSDTNSSTNNSDSVNTIFSKKDAANNLLVYLLGNEELNPESIIPVELAKETNVATKKENSNIFFYTSEPLTEKTTDGIVITISGYNSENKTYKYELRDYADLLQKQDMILAQGTVSKNGEVTSE